MRWIPVCSKRYFCYLPYLLDRGQFTLADAFFSFDEERRGGRLAKKIVPEKCEIFVTKWRLARLTDKTGAR